MNIHKITSLQSDLLIVALLLLHLLELRLDVLAQVVDGRPVLLDGVVLPLVPGLVVIQLVVDFLKVVLNFKDFRLFLIVNFLAWSS